MLKNYWKIAIRNLWKHKTFSFINIFGLAASISVCLLAILLIKDTHTYDTFHPDSEQVYRINTNALRKAGGDEAYATSPYIVGQTFQEDYSQVETWVPLVNRLSCDVMQGGSRIDGRGLFTNADFFQLFGFELLAGDPATALNNPYTIVLTSELAEILYPNQNPVGESLELVAYEQPFTVTGVLAPFPGKTHLEFNALSSVATLQALERLPDGPSITGEFQDYYSTYNFVRLKSDVEAAAIASLDDIARTHFEGLSLESRDAGYEFVLQPLDDITPGPMMSNNMGRALPLQVLWFLSALSIIVILSACFNYTNLTIARALTRAREVGVRKVLGANRRQVFGQFISEALFMALLALGVGFVLLQLTIPAFNSIQSLSVLDITLSIDASAVLLFVGFAVVVGMTAGLIPAAVLSRFSPLSIIQKLDNVRLFRRVGLRKFLIVSQFAISLIFILVMTIAWKQVNYAVGENFGANRTDVLNVTMYDHDYQQLKDAFSAVPEVRQITGISHLMGTWADSKVDVRVKQDDEPLGVRDYFVDDDYLNQFQLDLVAGQNFPERTTEGNELFGLVNESFLKIFDLGEPDEAIGQTILVGDSTQLMIQGVLADFLYKPLVYNIEPMLLRNDPTQLGIVNLHLQSTEIDATIAALERTWTGIDESRDLAYSFYDESITNTYSDIRDMAGVVGYFGTLGLLIACLGLLGMAIYSVETRAKEISIRKVIGASSMDLVTLLSRGYIILILVAVIVAVPLSFLIGRALLGTFAYSIPLNLWVFLPGVLLLLALGVLTIGSQTLRAAMADPVKNMRSE